MYVKCVIDSDLSIADLHIKRNFHRLGFSLFSVDSGDQKIKTFGTFFGFSARAEATLRQCTFFGFSPRSGHLRQFIWSTTTDAKRQLFLRLGTEYHTCPKSFTFPKPFTFRFSVFTSKLNFFANLKQNGGINAENIFVW